MQLQQTPVFLIVLLAIGFVSGHTIGRENHGPEGELEGLHRADGDRKGPESRVLDMESIFAGFAKSVISRTGGTSSQVPIIYKITIIIMLTYYNK